MGDEWWSYFVSLLSYGTQIVETLRNMTTRVQKLLIKTTAIGENSMVNIIY